MKNIRTIKTEHPLLGSRISEGESGGFGMGTGAGERGKLVGTERFSLQDIYIYIYIHTHTHTQIFIYHINICI